MDVTVIIALITAIAAIIAPLISSLISQRGAYKIKTAELFFTAKVDAYKNFLHTTAVFPIHPSSEDLQRFQSVCNCAMLFSSKETQSKIAMYGSKLTKRISSEADILSLNVSLKEAILSMQSELHQYQK